jgi:hypothetical protein
MRFVLLLALLAYAACDFPRPPDVGGDAAISPDKDAATDAAVGTDGGIPRCAKLGYAALPWPATGAKPYAVASADLNGDSKPDFAVVNAGDNTVSVLIGNGNGTFQPKVDYATGTAPQAVAIADVNGDGKPDLVIGNSATSPGTTMSVLIGNGDGTFGSKLDYPTNSAAQAIAVTDVSSDGKADVLVAGLNAVSVLLNNGNGTFSSKVDYTVGAGFVPRSIAIGDINSDGKPDLVLASTSVVGDGNFVSVFLGNGNGTFATHTDTAFNGDLVLFAVAIGDMNGDGKADVVTGNVDTKIVSVLLGNGKGAFTSTVNSPTASKPFSLTPADINGDGKTDLVVQGSAQGVADVTAMLGLGNGAFTEGVTYSIENSGAFSPQRTVLADINSDGRLDMLSIGADKLNILLGHGDGTFESNVAKPGGLTSRSLIVADVNHDGNIDVIVNNSDYTSVRVLPGNGDGTFARGVDYDIGSKPSSVIASDLNGDGRIDLVVANSAETVSVLIGTDEGTFAARVDYPTGPIDHVISADINNDGKRDLIISTDSVRGKDSDGGDIFLPGSIGLLMNNGDGTFTTRSDLLTNIFSSSIAVSDLNGDGNIDLIVAASGAVNVLLGTGTGTFLGPTAYRASDVNLLVIVDKTGDGKLDIVGLGSATITLWPGKGDGTFSAGVDVATASAVAIVDIVGDSSLDLIAFDSGGKTVGISTGNRDGTFQSTISYPVGRIPTSVAVADLNHDGQPDLIVDNSGDDTISVLLGVCIP